MATLVLDAYSKAYPSITNRIMASIFLESDPLAPIATIIDSTIGHPERIYHFTGLPRALYGFSLDEIDGADIPINNLALFSVVPSSDVEGILSRDDEQIKVGTTPGFDAGFQTIMFDGGEITPGVFRPNYIGWEIVPSELTGRGILTEGEDYSWNKVTGEMIWLIEGDILQNGTVYNIHFNPINNSTSTSTPTIIDFACRIVTETGNISLTDFGACLIVEPSGPYIELTLPVITTVPQGRLLTIELIKFLGGSVNCIRVLPNGADIISFLRGKIYIINNESIQIYRFRRPDLSNEWRVRNADGNFKRVGESTTDDAIQTGIFCKQLLDGSIKDKFQYARIYEEYVLTLPSIQVVDYDDWLTGNNKYFFSRANSANPVNLNKFYFPDRRGVFEKNNNIGKAGDFQARAILAHAHTTTFKKGKSDPIESGTEDNYFRKQGSSGANFGDEIVTTTSTGGSENVPDNYLINKYILI